MGQFLRIDVAQQNRCVLGAQYQDAVRIEIDNLSSLFVDVIAARRSMRSAERGLIFVEELLDEALPQGGASPEDQDQIDVLVIERDLANLSLGDERARLLKTKQRLATLLDIPPDQAAGLDLKGTSRDLDDVPPSLPTLIDLALHHRPYLLAQRLMFSLARAEFQQERAERFSDPYFLYTPYEFRDNSYTRTQSVTTWDAGIFVSVPLFNRNLGNRKRANLNVDQSRNEIAALERQVISEVEQASQDFENTPADAFRLVRETLPAVRRKRDRARARLRDGQIDAATFPGIQRDTITIVRSYRDTMTRHRRKALRINPVVGCRVIP